MPGIAEKVRELQDIIRQQFGVEATVNISIYTTYNPHLSKELANYISLAIANELKPDDIFDYANKQNNGAQWVNLYTYNKFDFAAFYDN